MNTISYGGSMVSAIAGLFLTAIAVLAEVVIPETDFSGSENNPAEIIPENFSTQASDLVFPTIDLPTSSLPDRGQETEATVNLSQTPAPETPRDSNNAAPTKPGLGERSRLTGERTQWEEAGITLDLEFTQYLQGLASGTGSEDFYYGGRLDGFIELDTEKLGWWDGGSLNAHLEYNFGALPDSLGGAFFPTNTGMGFPNGSPDVLTATSLYLSQKLGTRGSLSIGKINALDLAENDPFFGGIGIRRFQNLVFAGPPSGLVPPVMFGAIANVRFDPVALSFWVYDPEDRTQDYWPDSLFSEGLTFSLTTTYNTQIAKRPTTFSLTGIYTTKSGIDFSSISDVFRARIIPSTKQGSYSIGFQFSHLFHQLESNPRQGWGVFVKGAISDGNPNYVQNSIIAGIGGYGLFPERELDSFGVGYFYYDLSDELQRKINVRRGGLVVGDYQGFEAYYSYAVTPWFFLTGDVQYIDPTRRNFEDAFILGLRANIRF